jgi:membrane-bound acyltransferase YfiQ involved in biofilm formation
MIIIMVVVHHVTMTYGAIGRFYYQEPKELGIVTEAWFNLVFSFQQSFFMNLMFLVAGYFAASSFGEKGFLRFLANRAKRLILPTLFSMFALIPLVRLVVGDTMASPLDLVSSFGVMWFCVALFLFCALYAAFMSLFGKRLPALSDALVEPTHFKGFMLVGFIWIPTFALRIFFPIGSTFLGLRPSYIVAYAVMFGLGALSYHHGIIEKMDFKRGKWWLFAGLYMGTLGWLGLIYIYQQFGDVALLNGGATWESALFSAWDSFTCVALGFGIITLFKDRLNRQSPFSKALSECSFAVYVAHPLVLVSISVLIKGLEAAPIAKWAAVSLIGIVGSFLLAYILKKIPGLRSIL